jgi:phosphate transport system protein
MATHFQKELEKLKKRVLGLGAQVEDRLLLTGRAIESRELFDAERIIKSDYLIDEEEVEIEEDCLKILALYQPVAVDLRFLISTIKINSELERIADEATNIAHRLKRILQCHNNCKIFYDYGEQVERVQHMLNKGLDAMINLDVDTAFKVLLLDDEVDRLHHEMYQRVQKDMLAQPAHVEYLMNKFLISRHLERVGDHATNIAEEVIYLVEGEIVRHKDY